MNKLGTIFLGVGLILATIPRVTLEKTDEHLILTVGGAVPELIARTKKPRAIQITRTKTPAAE